jgi:branched-chain amino acid transport system permease protein
MVVSFVLLSELTKAWLLYLGLVFLLMVMFAPGGIASLIMLNLRVAAFGKWRRLLGAYGLLALTGPLMFFGAAAMIEMTYHVQLNMALGPEMRFLGMTLDVARLASWLGAAAALLVGGALFELARRRFARRWSEVQTEIAQEIELRGQA